MYSFIYERVYTKPTLLYMRYSVSPNAGVCVTQHSAGDSFIVISANLCDSGETCQYGGRDLF